MTFLTSDGFAYRRTYAGVPSGLFNTQYLDSFGNLFLIIDGFVEYGFTDEQIESILLFIMGDDNSGMTQLNIIQLTEFIKWFEEYALRRYNMVLSTAKSTVTKSKRNIETLSYTCNFGNPTRPIPKLVAQLCYPERGLDRRYMSARAIGIAYAAAASNRTFHTFCRDIYITYLPYADLSADIDLHKVKQMLPGYLKALDPSDIPFNFMDFPSFEQVADLYSRFAGPLSHAPKWNFAHFINAPDIVPPSSQTMFDYRLEHDIPRKDIQIIPADV